MEISGNQSGDEYKSKADTVVETEDDSNEASLEKTAVIVAPEPVRISAESLLNQILGEPSEVTLGEPAEPALFKSEADTLTLEDKDTRPNAKVLKFPSAPTTTTEPLTHESENVEPSVVDRQIKASSQEATNDGDVDDSEVPEHSAEVVSLDAARATHEAARDRQDNVDRESLVLPDLQSDNKDLVTQDDADDNSESISSTLHSEEHIDENSLVETSEAAPNVADTKVDSPAILESDEDDASATATVLPFKKRAKNLDPDTAIVEPATVSAEGSISTNDLKTSETLTDEGKLNSVIQLPRDPRKIAEERLASGQITPEQFRVIDAQLTLSEIGRRGGGNGGEGGGPPKERTPQEIELERLRGKIPVPSYFITDSNSDQTNRAGMEKLKHGSMNKKEIPKILRVQERLAAALYNFLGFFFNLEEMIAAENKHQQEHIRSIVDTGPDDNERWVFALPDAGGVYRDYNGKRVSAAIVRRQQHHAMENPSIFQALCAYEISKREETEQPALWLQMMEMMEHHHYSKTAMTGVIVGLQFMNKSMYLAYKHTGFDKDAHGHMNFKTTELKLEEGDQEYNEVWPDGKKRYPEGIKKIYAVNLRSYAHELAEKFNSYQYAFRPADIAIAYDITRKALRDSRECLMKGDIKSEKFQEAQYFLSRMRQAIEGSRYNTAVGEDGGVDPGGLQAQMERQQAAALEQSPTGGPVRRTAKAPARMSGPAVSMKLWELLAVETDKAGEEFFPITQIKISDYEIGQGSHDHIDNNVRRAMEHREAA